MAPASSLVPLEWPAAWKEPGLLELLHGSPFNCILFPEGTPAGLVARARERFRCPERIAWAKTEEIEWTRAGDLVAIGDAVWPSVGAVNGAGAVETGPTGAPWLDANGWLIRMARALAPASTVWIRSEPAENPDPGDIASCWLALCEARAHGAQRPLRLPPAQARQLAEGVAAAQAGWRRLAAAARWWEERSLWREWPPLARLLAISGFAGANANQAREFLNLASRRNLSCRIAPPERVRRGALRGMAAALYLDPQPMPPPLLQELQHFLEGGGLLISQAGPAQGLARLRPLEERHPRFTLFRCGQGRAAVSRQDWEDPYVLAQDAHLLMSRRQDAIRLFNAGSILAYPTVSPDGGRWLIHLLNYSRREAAHEVVLQTWAQPHAARLHQQGQESTGLKLHTEAGGVEVHLPPFAIHCAVELELTRRA